MGVGEALALRAQHQKLNLNVTATPLSLNPIPCVYILLGDGEMAEGQVWEAVGFAGFKKLNNLISIIDVNRLGQSQETMLGPDVQTYAKRVASFGWRTYVVEDGHDLELLDKAYSLCLKQSETSDKPAMIIAKTIKGKGVPMWEDKNGWHSKVLPNDQVENAFKELGEVDKSLRGVVQKPEESVQRLAYSVQPTVYSQQTSVVSRQKDNSPQPSLKLREGEISSPSYDKRGLGGVTVTQITQYSLNEKVATKKAFGNALVRLGSVYPDLIVLDCDVKNSTHTDQFEKKFPERFLQMYIAEQNLVCVAWGLARRGLKPFISTFACFLTRAHDQFRLAALSGVTMYVNGAYAGVSIGKDGPSQMALDDMAMIRPLLNTTLLYPSDAISTERLVEEMFKLTGIVYIKTTREPTSILYSASESFPIGGSKVLKSSVNDVVTLIAAGFTVFEALKAAEELKLAGIAVRIIDCYCLKPIDIDTLKKAAKETKAIITVEDHYAVGGLGDAVLEALAEVNHPPVYKLAVRKLPRSGSPQELLDYADISSRAIVEKVKQILNQN